MGRNNAMYKYSVTLKSGAVLEIELTRPIMEMFTEVIEKETGNKEFYLDWVIITHDDKSCGFRFSELAAFKLLSGPEEKIDV